MPRADRDIRSPHDLEGCRWACGLTFKRQGLVCWALWPKRAVCGPRRIPLDRASPARERPANHAAQHELDAIIVGNDVPRDPTLRTVFPDAEAFWYEYGFVPVNHLLMVRAEIAQSRPV